MNLHLKQEIKAPADKVWEILAHQFTDIANWTSSLEYSRAINSDELPEGVEVAATAPVPGRATPNPLGEIIEILVEYSEEDRMFTFLAFGLPPIISRMANTTRILEKGANRCLVTFDIEANFRGPFKLFSPILRRRILTSNAGPNGLLKDLKDHFDPI